MLKELIKPFQYKKVILDPKIGKRLKQKTSVNDWRGTLKKLWKYLIVHKLLLSLVMVMVVTSSGLSLLGPYLLGKAIDDYIVTNKMLGLLPVLVGLLLIYILHSLS